MLLWPPQQREDYNDHFKEVDGKTLTYWEHFSAGTCCGLVPHLQASDWKKFRAFQFTERRGKGIVQLERDFNQQRQVLQLGGEIHLSHPRDQDRVTTWMEFQHYHLDVFEKLKKDVERGKADLEECLEEIEKLRKTQPYGPRTEEEKLQQRVETNFKDGASDFLWRTRQHVKWHPVMRSWITDQLQIMRDLER
jgi:hypothetical protein